MAFAKQGVAILSLFSNLFPLHSSPLTLHFSVLSPQNFLFTFLSTIYLILDKFIL